MKRLIFICAMSILLVIPCACQSAKENHQPQSEAQTQVPVRPEQKPIAPPPLPSSDELKSMLVAELIMELAVDDFKTREKATGDLILACELLGESSLNLIKSVLGSAHDPEVRMRLERVLAKVELCFGNIIINPSFEDGFNGWKFVDDWNGSKIKLVNAEPGEAPEGNHYLEMWHNPAKGNQMWSSSWSACGQDIRHRIKPGILYEIRFWYKTSHPYGFRIAISDEGLVMHSSLGIGLGTPEADGKWHEVKGTLKVTREQLDYEPFLTLYYDYMAPGTIWFDKISVKKVTEMVKEK